MTDWAGRAVPVLLLTVLGATPVPRGHIRLEDVTYSGDSAQFAATLARPERSGRVPAIVLLHGSEPGRRDGAFALRLRDRLVPLGLAVLSFDKRGIGGSSGRYQELPDLNEAAGDGLAAVRYLLRRTDIDSARIGVIGASQGGWVGPLMAAKSARVAFVVSISGPGMSPYEQGRFEDASRLLEAGLDSAAVAEVDSLRESLIAYWEGRVGAGEPRARWKRALARPWFDVVHREDPLFSRLGRLAAPPAPSQMPAEFFELLDHGRYDPVPTAERVLVPVLHVYGAADLHVPVDESIRRLRPAYERGGNRDVTFAVIPHAGHGLQLVTGDQECLKCARGSVRTSAPGAWEMIDRWLAERGAAR